jgi:TolA-binding protein
MVPGSDGKNLAEALKFLKANQADRARPLLEALLASPTAAPLRTTARYYLARALVAERLHGEASAHLAEILASDFEALWEPEALWLLGCSSERRGRIAEARRLWEEALERFPTDRDVAARAERALRALKSRP